MINSPVEEIKNRLNIVEVIGSYLKLQKAGVNYRAVCPFHSEKKPSFFVSPSRQIWHCFGGCSIGGDIFKFVMKIEGVEFGDALRILAQKAGVELRKQSPEAVQWKTERVRLYEIFELATRFFEKQLEGSEAGKEARKYLISRGLTEESLKKWRIGYAPDTWEGLSAFLTSRGYQKEETEKAGLTSKSEQGSFYDRFRGRIIFPVFDLNSQPVGFGGRVFKEKDKQEIAKYVNTPQTLLYDKSRILYGLDKAKVAIRKNDSCIMVEGYIDLIMVSQSGFENVVATSGTALTPFQLNILKRYTENILTAFDMDIAGDKATKRGIDLAQIQGFNVKVIVLPENLDPADLILKDLKEWENQVEKARSILDFYFETTLAKFDRKTPEGKKDISKIILPVIKKVQNKIVRSHWVGRLARELEVKEGDVEEELAKVKLEDGAYEPELKEALSVPVKTRQELLEERLLTLILKQPQCLEALGGNYASFCSDQTAEILNELRKEPDINLIKFPPEIAGVVNYLILRSEMLGEEMEEKEVAPEIKNCLNEMHHLEVKSKLNHISGEIKKAEQEKDLEKIYKLSQEFNTLSKTYAQKEN